ncbi:MAG: carbohydrate porin [Nitrosomonadales bacterium]|nr:carbohydrate porin [Nitrosomonadales bacterium]
MWVRLVELFLTFPSFATWLRFLFISLQRGYLKPNSGKCIVKLKQFFAVLCTASLCTSVTSTYAATPVPESLNVSDLSTTSDGEKSWTLHAQSTYIPEWKNNFNSPYSGAKSFLNSSEGDIPVSYTLTATAFLGARLWQGGEVYYNPEFFQGIPFSDLAGLGAFTNGEQQKGTAIPAIHYAARAYIRQTFGLGGEQEHVQDGFNQVAGNYDKQRIVISYGAFSALDYFDANAYSHDPRTQFMNWSIATAGAYDYAANSRGLTFGLVGEYFANDWVIRAGRLALPPSPNILELDYNLKDNYGHQVEITHQHFLWSQPGKLRVLVFQNHGLMANYTDAINQSNQANNGSPPNILTARSVTTKNGYLINLEQALAEDVGIFSRWSRNDGQSEAISYDIGQSLSGGVLVKGTSWGRKEDSFGAGFAINRLSAAEIQYLQLGGVTMMIGDGQLRYKEEQILEVFYSAKVYKGVYISSDYQRYANPGYNADRGPVNIYSLRAHIEI